jgi:hypothetical protein
MIDWRQIAELTPEIGEEDFAEGIELFFEDVADVLENLGD